ncbi:MAG: DEAD/DEAH box helicase family protein [Chloroflexi bacterium]|nr:DEAD/DEAH box helicase family protein [Chloroflexota bacterium]
MKTETLDDYITTYGTALQTNAQRALAPLHVPGRDPLPYVPLNRTLLEAQAHVVAASRKALEQRKGVFMVAECGTGKTIMALATMHGVKQDYNALVFCPGHITAKWEREIKGTIPGAKVVQIKSWKDLIAIKGVHYQGGAVWYVISRDTAKLGADWDHAMVDRGEDDEGGRLYCPACGERQAGKSSYLRASELTRRKRKCDCGENLWTWKCTKNTGIRWSPAKYIHKHMKRFFDYLVIDECHEEKDAQSKQGQAVGSLIAAVDKTLLLTGTVIGGYAEHLRPLLWKVSPRLLLDDGFKFTDKTKFSVQYGRIETKVSKTTGGKRRVKTTTTRTVRPGVMPTMFGRHLLGCSVFLGLDEVSDALPRLTEEVMPIELDIDVMAEYQRIEHTLGTAMRAMAARRDLRLCGTLINATMNWVDHPFGWPDLGYADGDMFQHVVTPQSFDPQRVYPKEAALINLCRRERDEGRQTWVFVENTNTRDVVARLESMLNQNGLSATSLRQKVPLAKRERWIQTTGSQHDVVLSHPKLVETGLDLFDKEKFSYNFSTLVFYEVGFNLFTVRQASRRHWRISQPTACRTYFMHYNGTMQARAVSLMARKMAAATALEGQFSSEGLAAMAGDSVAIELELARSLDKNLDQGQRTWDKSVTF